MTNFYPTVERLYANLLRQVTAPWTPRLGAPYRLDFFAEAGFAPAPRSIQAFVSLLPARPRIPLPFGLLGIDLTTSVGPAFLQTSAPSGQVSVTFTIPPIPSLAGKTLHTQALVIHAGNRARLTNVNADVMLR